MVRNFKIALNRPLQKTFFPGTEVSGTLSFEVQRPKSHHHVTVALLGRAHVHWTDHQRDRRTHTANEDILSMKTVVWEKEQATGGGKLQTGHYSFPFRFTIPDQDLPSSFGTLDSIGWIRYYIEGRIGTGQMKFDHVVQAVFPFAGLVDVNSPDVGTPVSQEARRMTCCCGCLPRRITLTAEVPRSGYCIGEVIPLNIAVENGSRRQVKVSVILTQTITYHAKGARCDNHFVVIGVASEPMPGRSWTTWSPGDELRLPQTALSLTSSDVINIQYVLMVTAVISWSRNLTTVIPITVGNVPVQNQNQPSVSATHTPAPPPKDSPISAPPTKEALTSGPPTRAPPPPPQGRSTPDFPSQDQLTPRVLFSPSHSPRLAKTQSPVGTQPSAEIQPPTGTQPPVGTQTSAEIQNPTGTQTSAEIHPSQGPNPQWGPNVEETP